jgi:bacterial/archaeal transporter family protein
VSQLSRWIVPALTYVVATGVLGVTSKLALREVDWRELVIWSAFAYAAFAAILWFSGARVHLNQGAFFAIISGILAAGTLAVFVITVGRGDVSQTVPFMSAYPVVTVLLSIVVLSEGVNVAKAAGVGLVIGGLVLLSR